MGIGSTMKSMLNSDHDPPTSDTAPTFTRERGSVVDTRSGKTSIKPPSGKPPMYEKDPTEIAMEHDLQRSRTNRSSAGYGTDAAAALGGTLAGTHEGGHKRGESTGTGNTGRRDTVFEGGTAGGAKGVGSGNPDAQKSELNADGRSYGAVKTAADMKAPGTNPPAQNAIQTNSIGTKTTPGTNVAGPQSSAGTNASGAKSSGGPPNGPVAQDLGMNGALGGAHLAGHTKHNPRDLMPDGKAQEDTNQLQPVVHQKVRHLETEEVCRVKEHERHVHHIQHHIQPIVAREEMPEQVHERVHPVTHISEKHANKVEDNTLFDGQVRQTKDSVVHVPKERAVIDKGVTVKEHIHHHIHHVIQPVIEKEVLDRHRIHTTIPIHEITHEAPVVHQSQTHAPVPLEHFLQRGGILTGAVSQDDIRSKILHGGHCSRDVDGIAEKLEKELHLGKSNVHTHDDPPSSAVDGKKADLAKTQKHSAATTAPNVDQPTSVPTKN
ncbi:hypothetical protein NLJ89_g3366 [Agrocybe chaxingu]|uniref:Allergen n=1 Tax=Agrocybe chaxingu TaxID=84603 RepID=A0A9W8K4S0_9AGAR|nr:hypothetical protein NLJ89_g3366 [Agrocybe chaxingu]